MKLLYLVVVICFSQKIYSQGTMELDLNSLNISLACITLPQLLQATGIACQQKGNTSLWQKVIDCHRPISDEFFRVSAEARCPHQKHVENPMDRRFSIQEVFLNICGITEGSPEERMEGISCLINGRKHPFIMSHEVEVRMVNFIWGKKALCNLGKCILKLFHLN